MYRYEIIKFLYRKHGRDELTMHGFISTSLCENSRCYGAERSQLNFCEIICLGHYLGNRVTVTVNYFLGLFLGHSASNHPIFRKSLMTRLRCFQKNY